jgi:hypothetical protein
MIAAKCVGLIKMEVVTSGGKPGKNTANYSVMTGFMRLSIHLHKVMHKVCILTGLPLPFA